MAEFDRSNPLFERNSVPFEVITSPNNTFGSGQPSNNNASTTNTHHGNFTVRILQGHRPATGNSGGDKERVIRFEMSDECNLIDNLPATSNTGLHTQQHHTPNRPTPIIHAPFLTADRGQGQSSIMQQRQQPPPHQTTPYTNREELYPRQSSLPTRPIELYELEVGESDFADLRRDQALLVDYSDFANSLISLLQFCQLGEEGSSSQQPSSQYGPPAYPSSAGGYNQMNPNHSAQQQHQHGTWNTPSHHTAPQYQSPFGKMTNTGMPVSTYACRLEVDGVSSAESCTQWRKNQQANTLYARFSIVESNQFRELTHLALNLTVGTDKSVRCYLSSRYVFITMCAQCTLHYIPSIFLLYSHSIYPLQRLPADLVR